MRVLSFLLAMLMISLTCYPCTDDNSHDAEKYSYSVTNPDATTGELDLCSPCCSCKCCRTQVNPAPEFNFEAPAVEYPEHNSDLREISVTLVPHPIWQPPRLA